MSMMGTSLKGNESVGAMLVAAMVRIACLGAVAGLILGGIASGIVGVLVALLVICGVAVFAIGMAAMAWFIENG